MKTKTIDETMTLIEQAPQQRDVCKNPINPGEYYRQGDVQINRVARRGDRVVLNFPGDRVSIEVTPKKVLAEGESIQIAVGQGIGSRHVIEAGAGVRVCQPSIEHPLVGPVIEVDEGATALLTHPEHRHFELGPGLYQATFQRDHMKEELARVRD